MSIRVHRTACSLALTAVLAPACVLHAQTSGISHPEAVTDSATDTYVPPAARTTAARAQSAQPSQQAQMIESPVTDHPTFLTKPSPAVAVPADDAVVMTDSPSAPQLERYQRREVRHEQIDAVVTDDPTSGVVMDVPSNPNDLPSGVSMKARLTAPISTRTTEAGALFDATLVQDVTRNGKVYVPSGSVLHGRVMQVKGGRRIFGGAALRLQPDTVTLPDGQTIRISAEVTDLDHFRDAQVRGEGQITRNNHTKGTLAAMTLTTGSAAAAGAVIGGGPGAVVGASVGAGAGLIWWLKKDTQILLPKDTEIVVMLDRPLEPLSRQQVKNSGK